MRVGTKGSLGIEYARADRQTIIAGSHCTSPWHLCPPIYLDESGAAYTLLLNPSGGLVGGDDLRADLTIGTKAHVIISTPSANRVYRSLSAESIQTVNMTVEDGGILEWLPEPTIPFAGSRFRQTLQVRLARGAAVLLWDAWAAGRVARNERWAFACLDNDVRITTASSGVLAERFRLDSTRSPDPAGIVRAWNYAASLYVVSDAVDAAAWKTLEVRLGDLLDAESAGLLGGVSRPAVPGLVVKLVTRSAPVLTATLERLWAAVRLLLWGLPPVSLRKY
jgi:urease accessory protein